MIVPVHMLAFEEPERIRQVDIPDVDAKACKGDEDLLELVFYYGQNDFQPKPCCSVSVGDVARLKGEYWLVAPVGWIHLTLEELEAHRAVPRQDRSLNAYKIARAHNV